MSGEQDTRDRARRLMMAALDGEITSDERKELDALFDGDAELRAEWERLSRVKEVTSTMTFIKPPDEMWGRYWTGVYNRIERGIGWILVSIGATVLTGYVVWEWLQMMLADTEIPTYIKLAIFAVVIGGVILLVSVIREKLFTHRHDPYKEVER